MIWFTVSALYIDFYVVGRAAGLLFCLTTALTLGVVHTYAARCYALLSPARAAGCVAGLSSAMRGGAWDRLREIVVASDTCCATRCCARKSNSMYFSGGVKFSSHIRCAALVQHPLCFTAYVWTALWFPRLVFMHSSLSWPSDAFTWNIRTVRMYIVHGDAEKAEPLALVKW